MSIKSSSAFRDAGLQLDARGWLCPRPVIEARRLLREAAHGDRLHVILTDPHGPLDFEVFCARSGHRLLANRAVEDTQPAEWHLLIECADG